MLRTLFLLPVLLFTGVSATFNVLFSLTLNEGGFDTIEGKAWVALGVAAALYSGLALDIARTNFKRGSPAKGIVALLFMFVALAWDARCAYGFANLEQERARAHVADEARKRATAERRVTDARKALQAYADAPDPIAADAAVDAIGKRVAESRCTLRHIPEDVRELCGQLSEARISAANAHAKTRLAKAVEDAEQLLNNTKAPPARDAFADLVGPDIAKWMPAIVLQLGTLLGMFAAAIPRKAPSPCEMPAKAPNPVAGTRVETQTTQGATPLTKRATAQIRSPELTTGNDVVDTIARLIREPEQCPAGIGVDGKGWLAGSQRRLATKIGMPVSRLNEELKKAAKSGILEVDTSGGVTRLRITRH